jgi:hypothetical protein
MKLTIGPAFSNDYSNSYTAELEPQDFPIGINDGTSDDKYLLSAFSAVKALQWDWVKDVVVVQGTWNESADDLYEDFVDRRLGIHNHKSFPLRKRIRDIVDYPIAGEQLSPLQASYYISACYLETKRFTIGHKTSLDLSTITGKITDLSIDLGRFINPENFAGYIAMRDFNTVSNSCKLNFIDKFGGTIVNKLFEQELNNSYLGKDQISLITFLYNHDTLSEAVEIFNNLPADVTKSLFN